MFVLQKGIYEQGFKSPVPDGILEVLEKPLIRYFLKNGFITVAELPLKKANKLFSQQLSATREQTFFILNLLQANGRLKLFKKNNRIVVQYSPKNLNLSAVREAGR